MNRTMDLNRLTIFARVVEAKGISAAARQLEMPKSSVSRAIAQLEEEVGAPLLKRTTRTVALTASGTLFYERVSSALGDIREATQRAREGHGLIDGTVRITAPGDVADILLAPLLTQFLKEHPTIHVDAVVTNRVVNLEEEHVDLAIRMGEPGASHLIARRLRPLTSGLFASAAYLREHGVPRSPKELSQHELLIFRPRTHFPRELKLQGPHGEVSLEPKGRMTSDDMRFLGALTAAGAGIALLPTFPCEKVSPGPITRLLPEYHLTMGNIFLVHAPSKFIPERVRLLRKALLTQLGPQEAQSAKRAELLTVL